MPPGLAQQPANSSAQQYSASGISVNGYSPTSRTGWAMILDTLSQAEVRALSAQEVVFAQSRGVPLIDVRPREQYDAGHIPGALSVPFYQPITGWDPVKVVRRLGYALFGVLNGTEVNPNFTVESQALVHPELGAILYCSIGGSLEKQEGASRGLQSRSVIAAWQLVSSGSNKIAIMRGGYSEWYNNGRDVEVIETESEA